MHTYIHRNLEAQVKSHLDSFPVVAILGARQVGKSTLARKLVDQIPKTIFLDLENDRDLDIIRDPWAFFTHYKDHLICLDEIQRLPEIFTQIRSYVDQRNRNSQFLILGSASPELLKQSSESLAGRISYLNLPPFQREEISSISDLHTHWLRGGFPRSYLSDSDSMSLHWRENFVKTFLERDLSVLGLSSLSGNLGRLWKMCAHLQGNVLNMSRLAEPMGVSQTTIRRYLGILEMTYLLRILPPWQSKSLKRLVKSPKVYIRDSGLLHSLLGIETYGDLLGHPCYGSSFEGYVIESILNRFPRYQASFLRTSNGNELDLILSRGMKKYVVEIKSSTSANLGRGFKSAIDMIQPDRAWVIAQVEQEYPYKGSIVTNLDKFLNDFSIVAST